MKHFLFTLVVLAIIAVAFFVQADPSQAIDAAMRQVNGGSQESTSMFLNQTLRSNTPIYSAVAVLLTTFAFYGRAIKRAITTS